MCGIAGAWFPKNVSGTKVNTAIITSLMLSGLQHRGHEGAGISSLVHGIENDIVTKKGVGLVFDIFSNEILENMKGHCSIGHNRYSTSGRPDLRNIQPFEAINNDGLEREKFSIAHNGNLTSKSTGMRPSESDTWNILQALNRANNVGKPLHLRVCQALKKIEGSYSLVMLHQGINGGNSLIIARDPSGNRPLWIAKYRYGRNKGEIGYLVASETCAFDKVAVASLWRPVKPGEIIVINKFGVKSFMTKSWCDHKKSRCIFELIYFMHPTSIVDTPDFKDNPVYVYQVREALGRELSKEHPGLTADFMVGVPDSSNFHTIGMSRKSGISIDSAIIRNHSVGRTFISPSFRVEKIVMKFSFLLNKFLRIFESKNPRIVICDDSIVRSSTMKSIINRIRQLVGNTEKRFKKKLEIIVAVFSPPVRFPCFLGISTSTKNELAWNAFSGLSGIEKEIKADRIIYLTLSGLFRATEKKTGFNENEWCAACFNGKYDYKIDREDYKKELAGN